MVICLLFLTSILACFLSAIVGGGSPFILIPIITALAGAGAVAPVITTGMLFNNGQRALFLKGNIEWKIIRQFAPGAVIGSILGAFILSLSSMAWLNWILALFLICSALSRVLSREATLSTVKPWHFAIVGLGYGLLSAIVGSAGPALIPFCQGYGLEKNQVLATKSLQVTIVHTVKLVAYCYFGILTAEHLALGTIIALGSIPGNVLALRVISRIPERRYQQFLTGFVFASGVGLIMADFGLLLGAFEQASLVLTAKP